MTTLTQEQVACIEAAKDTSDNRILAISARAGSGKTSTLKDIVEAYQPKSGLVTAFNKAIIKDTQKKIGNLIDCSTMHSMAYKYCKPAKGIEEMNYDTIIEDVSYEDKALVIETLDEFFRSASIDIREFAKSKTQVEYLQDLAEEYAYKMLDGEIPGTFNYMLKCMHLMLHTGELELEGDFFAIDEAQDTTAVVLEIFKLIKANRKIIIGDTYQNIYSFMNTVNAFEELPNINLLNLTKSFRCNDYIASIVDEFGKRYLDEKFTYEGTRQKENTNKIAYITRTNASLIERMYKLLQEGKTFTLTRSVNEIFALPIALLNASKGRSVYDKRYKYLEREYRNYLQVRNSYLNYFEYIAEVTEDAFLSKVAKTLSALSDKGINLYNLKEKITDMLINNSNKSVILTTAHAFKGLEADYVYLEDDLNHSVNRAINDLKQLDTLANRGARKYLSRDSKEDLNTYYVALSRAKTNIENVRYI